MKFLKGVAASLTAVTMMASAMASSSAVMSASAATASLYLSVTQLTSSVSTDYGTVPSGAYAVSVCIKNNPGLSGLGLTVNLTNMTAYISKNNVEVTDGKFSPTTAINTNKSIGFACSKGSNVTVDGTLFTFYVSKASSGTASIEMTLVSSNNLNGASVLTKTNGSASGSISSSSAVKIGDVTGDSSVDSADSTKILSALSNHNVSSATIKTVNASLSSWFPTVKMVEQADVNSDGYVNKTDSNEILSYYAKTIAGTTYTGKAGKTYYYFN